MSCEQTAYDTELNALSDELATFEASRNDVVDLLEETIDSAATGEEDANDFFNAVDKYGADIEGLSACISTMNMCLDPEHMDDDECTCPQGGLSDCSYYECNRLVMYYVDSIVEIVDEIIDYGGELPGEPGAGEAETYGASYGPDGDFSGRRRLLDSPMKTSDSGKDCDTSSRADCVVSFAGQALDDAAETMSQVVDSSILDSYADLLVQWETTCAAYNDATADCEDSLVLDNACFDLDGDDFDSCQTAVTQVDSFCAEATEETLRRALLAVTNDNREAGKIVEAAPAANFAAGAAVVVGCLVGLVVGRKVKASSA